MPSSHQNRNERGNVLAPGANVLIRDEAWRVRRVQRTSLGQQALHVVGISELVRDEEAIFIAEYEKSIEILAPETTELVQDDSARYRKSRLYMESLLRRIPPTDDRLHIGHQAAMDLLEYQLEPATQALNQVRQRILIADAVGLGKTMEAGILMSELIKRGRGKRILVVAIKSMLTQFQKEMWTRFTIPLVRLDSIGLQRIRQNIPTNQNPFYYYDKTIISIDTLKQNNEYRIHLENAWWDIIVIDEAHNVAVRGNRRSQRAALAELLAHRSDTLIMLSATPHDGNARSFASLMNMLDPTAIANPEDYGEDEIDGLFVRRFKKDVVDQVREKFPERQITQADAQASQPEEEAFQMLSELQFTALDQVRRSGSMLFKTSLEKALLSSPAACLSTLENRIRRLERQQEKAEEERREARSAEEGSAEKGRENGPAGDSQKYTADLAALRNFHAAVASIGKEDFTKYQRLLDLFENDDHFSFTGHFRNDRVVIFTESIPTMHFLAEHLQQDLDLDERKVQVLHGSMSDVEQQEIVEAFGQEKADIRLLIASDVASEGINLHYQCHRMVHFDIPWSLMKFQQRNGRIDRYGQTEVPRILYLVTRTDNEQIRDDTRILEILIEKDEQATLNIGDPSALAGVYSIEAEEYLTADAIETRRTPEDFAEELTLDEPNRLELLLAGAQEQSRVERTPKHASLLSLFGSDYDFTVAALDQIRTHEGLDYEEQDGATVSLAMPQDLEDRFEMLPDEIFPSDNRLALSADPDLIQQAMDIARTEEHAWPEVHYLWPLNPVLTWLEDRMAANFGRHTAPVLDLGPGSPAEDGKEAEGESAGGEGGETKRITVIASGLIPNKKSQPLIHRWFGVVFERDAANDDTGKSESSKGVSNENGDGWKLLKVEDFSDTASRSGLSTGQLTNPHEAGTLDLSPASSLLQPTVDAVRQRISEIHVEFEERKSKKYYALLQEIDELRQRQLNHLEERYEGKTDQRSTVEKAREQRSIESIFDEYIEWVDDTLTSRDRPFIQIIAVLLNS